MNYIATFFSHFGAMRFHKLCGSAGWRSKPGPVPRDLSSSCGTCVRYEAGEEFLPCGEAPDELEQIVEAAGNGYILNYRAGGS